MQTDDWGPPSTAQEKPSEAAGGSMRVRQYPEVFKDIPALAVRLGVAPCSIMGSSTILLTMRDGTYYSLFDLINAFLNKVDAAETILRETKVKG